MAITPLPTPPSRNDPTNFSARGDAFLGALPDFATEANALAVDVNLDAVAAAAAEVAATAAAAAATAAANVTKWVSGTTYAEGVVVWSPITYLSYRRKTAGAGTTDPSADSTNWAQAAGTGDVTLTGTQTLTNKTIDIANNTLTGVQPTLVSGTNIKTVNSTSLLGSGDVDVQPRLVSGTNIKTINGGSVLGSGNLAITGGSWIKLSSSVAFGSSAVDFTGFVTSDYNTYAVVLYAFSVQSGSYAAFRFYVGGTLSTSGYTSSGFYTDAGGTFAFRGGSSGTDGQLISITNATNLNQAGVILINANNYNSLTGTSVPSMNSQIGGGTSTNTNFYKNGSLNTTSPITGIRIFVDGGTFAGYFDLYGIKR